MGIGRKATALLTLGLVLSWHAPAWSGDSAATAPNVQSTLANPSGTSLLGMLNSVLTGTTNDPPKPEKRCKPSQLYSGHDVVGDPETCIMGRLNVSGGSTGVAVGAP